jgi:rubredoxin
MERKIKKYDSNIRCNNCGVIVENYKSTNESVIIKSYQIVCSLCWKQIEQRSKEVEKRLVKLEEEVFSDWICDNCGKKATFQTGENKEGEIASWCSNKCQKAYTHQDKREIKK